MTYVGNQPIEDETPGTLVSGSNILAGTITRDKLASELALPVQTTANTVLISDGTTADWGSISLNNDLFLISKGIV